MDDLTSYQRKHFLNGPGKLCKGLALTRAENGILVNGAHARTTYILHTGDILAVESGDQLPTPPSFAPAPGWVSTTPRKPSTSPGGFVWRNEWSRSGCPHSAPL